MFIRVISYINPLTYQLNALRDICFEIPNLTNVYIVFALTIVSAIVAIYSVKNAKLITNER